MTIFNVGTKLEQITTCIPKLLKEQKKKIKNQNLKDQNKTYRIYRFQLKEIIEN